LIKEYDYCCTNNIDILMGMGGITNIQWENKLGEISLIINPTLQGKGYGIEAVDMLLHEAFDNLGLKTVFGECYYCNEAVEFWLKIADKYKGSTAVLPNRKLWQGKFYDSLYFSIDAALFAAGQGVQPSDERTV